ncbi:MAG: class II SORL domain-containing protein [Deltaproteobacteria bacterium]
MKSVAVASATIGLAGRSFGAERFYPVKVDPGLFQTINRVKDPANKTPLEMVHGPVIKAPMKVTAGEPFTVEVSIGEHLHPMGPNHWIEFIALNVGNEPAGRVEFQSRGYLKPKATFTLMLTKESAPEGKVSLVVHQRCNLHGYWEGAMDIQVA